MGKSDNDGKTNGRRKAKIKHKCEQSGGDRDE